MKVVIPARAGSKRLKGKNLMEINGKPLIIFTADKVMANLPDAEVLICTEDEEIAGVARAHGYQVLMRPAEMARDNFEIDHLTHWIAEQLSDRFWLWQPTVVLSDYSWLDGTINAGGVRVQRNLTKTATEPWTLVGKEHLAWQSTRRGVHPEIGVRFYPKMTGGLPVNPKRIPDHVQWVDIDTFADLQAARSLANGKKRIGFIYRQGGEFGWGHRRRVEAIAREFQDGEVNLYTDNVWDTAPDVFVVDHLDTTANEILNMKSTGAKVVTLEDTGPGAAHADLTINALLKPDPDKRHHLYGPDYFILRPEFLGLPEYVVRRKANKVLVTFGGQDPLNMTERLQDTAVSWTSLNGWQQLLALAGWDIDYVTPPLRAGSVESPTFSMAERMMAADLVVTSGGRTLLEAAAVGVPAVALCANVREMGHGHLGTRHGNVNMGLADRVHPSKVWSEVEWLMDNYHHRLDLSNNAKRIVDGKGLRRVVRLIRELV